jgi:hypothetical protein
MVKYWVLTAPLGELPRAGDVAEVVKKIRKFEAFYRARRLIKGDEEDVPFVMDLLSVVSKPEGVAIFQENGGRVSEAYVKRYGRPSVSVLVAVGVHAERSVYVLAYDRIETTPSGDPFDITREVRDALDRPEVRRELLVLEERLLRRYGGLPAPSREKRPFNLPVVEAEERGHLVFFFNPLGDTEFVAVGRTPLPVRWLPGKRKLRELDEEALVRHLRDQPVLEDLPPRAVRGLLRGEFEGVEAVERTLRLAQLARF